MRRQQLVFSSLVASLGRKCSSSSSSSNADSESNSSGTGEQANRGRGASGKGRIRSKSSSFKATSSSEGPRLPILSRIIDREMYEELARYDAPVAPVIPRGWTYFHTPGDQFITLSKKMRNERGQMEELRIFCPLPRHQPGVTYHEESGERMEVAHYTFYLFITKPDVVKAAAASASASSSDGEAVKRGLEASSGNTTTDFWNEIPQGRVYQGMERNPNGANKLYTEEDVDTRPFTGGMEFVLTSIDCELILDACIVHETREELINASTASYLAHKKRDDRYRGPSVNELDDDLADETVNYLDDRGLNNAFAEYISLQCIHAEDVNYRHFLELQKRFAEGLPAPGAGVTTK